MNEEVLHCTACPFITTSSRKLGRHTASLHANWKYHCSLCQFESGYVASLYRHKKEVHNIGHENDIDALELPDDDQDAISEADEDLGFSVDSKDNVDADFHLSGAAMNRSGGTSHSNVQSPTVRTAKKRGIVNGEASGGLSSDSTKNLLPCRVQRTYFCSPCDLTTHNPRDYLYHLRDVHGEKLRVFECEYCLYASRHQQKLQRHISFVHPAKLPTDYSTTTRAKPAAQKSMRLRRTSAPINYSLLADEGEDFENDMLFDQVMSNPSSSHYNDSSAVEDYMSSLFNVQTVEEPPEEEILEIIDGEVDEVMNMSSLDDASPYNSRPPVTELDYKCSICHFKSKSKLLVQHHEKVTHAKKKFHRCKKCNFVTNMRSRYMKHLQIHDASAVSSKVAGISSTQYKPSSQFNNHIEEAPFFNCTQCPFVGATKHSLSFHMKQHHQDSKKDSANLNNVEAAPAENYSELNGIAEHNAEVIGSDNRLKKNLMRSRRGGKMFRRRFRCRFCTYRAVSRSALKRHEAHHQDDHGLNEPNESSLDDQALVLGSGTSASGSVGDIQFTEGPNKMLRCKICSYEAKWMSEMIKHNRIHTQEKPFVCPFCGFRSRWKGDMTRHIQKYHKEDAGEEEHQDDNSQEANGNLYAKPFTTTSKRRRVDAASASSSGGTATSSSPGGGEESVRNQSEAKDLPVSATSTSSKVATQSATTYRTRFRKRKLRLKNSVTYEPEAEPLPSSENTTPRPGRRHYRCPQCTFTASTASRFHVHIVAHLNQRPFMCSECGCRSNWQWDITKHIRIKTTRQGTHHNATLITLCDTGEKNYEKYNKFIVYENGPPAAPAPALIRTPAKDDSAPNADDTTKRDDGSFWKCKQCDYRTPYKRLVLYHVPKHSSGRPYFCGECGQSSMWRQNVERHCKSRHSNKIRVVENKAAILKLEAEPLEEEPYNDMDDKEGFFLENSTSKEPPPSAEPALPASEANKLVEVKRHACKICPYRTRKSHDMYMHMRLHQPQPGAIFKCMFCPFYTSLRRSLLQHMKLHVSKPREYISNALENQVDDGDNCDDGANEAVRDVECDDTDTLALQPMTSGVDGVSEPPATHSATESSIPATLAALSNKRYSCDHCPYTSNSKTQFLYHKQFHRSSRSCHFKCQDCNYAVSKSHLLMQHVRLHAHAKATTVNHKDTVLPVKVGNSGQELANINKNHSEGLTVQHVEREIPKIKPVVVDPSTKDSLKPSITTGRDNITIHSNVSDETELGIPLVWCSKGTIMMKMFKCRYCPHVNKRRSNIREHEKMHRKRKLGRKFSCAECTYVCSNLGVLSSHMKVHRNTSQVEGEEAIADVEYPDVIDIEPTKKVLFHCLMCSERFTRQGDLNIHYKFHGANLPWKCTHCTYGAKHRSQLYRHMKVHSPHYQGRSSEAEIVPDEASNQPAHFPPVASSTPVRVSPIKSSGEVEKKHVCHLCPATFLKPSSLAYHLSLHGGTGKFKCPHCNYAVKNVGNVCRHVKIHERTRMKDTTTSVNQVKSQPVVPKRPERKHVCAKCPATFSKLTRFHTHSRLHGSNQQYTCKECDYSVKFIANLLKHQKIHVPDDGPKVASTPTLVSDTVTAPTAAPRSLSLSEQQMVMLLQHQQQMAQQQHLGEEARRLFFCDHCPYQNPRKDAVLSHMRRHNDNQEIVCQYCDYGTTLQSFLREHMKLHFRKPKKQRTDGYLKYEQLEVWVVESSGESSIAFKDNGEEFGDIGRFVYPGCENDDLDQDEAGVANVGSGSDSDKTSPQLEYFGSGRGSPSRTDGDGTSGVEAPLETTSQDTASTRHNGGTSANQNIDDSLGLVVDANSSGVEKKQHAGDLTQSTKTDAVFVQSSCDEQITSVDCCEPKEVATETVESGAATLSASVSDNITSTAGNSSAVGNIRDGETMANGTGKQAEIVEQGMAPAATIRSWKTGSTTARKTFRSVKGNTLIKKSDPVTSCAPVESACLCCAHSPQAENVKESGNRRNSSESVTPDESVPTTGVDDNVRCTEPPTLEPALFDEPENVVDIAAIVAKEDAPESCELSGSSVGNKDDNNQVCDPLEDESVGGNVTNATCDSGELQVDYISSNLVPEEEAEIEIKCDESDSETEQSQEGCTVDKMDVDSVNLGGENIDLDNVDLCEIVAQLDDNDHIQFEYVDHTELV